MELPRSVEHSTVVHALGRQHQRQLSTRVGQLRQLSERLLRIARAHDPIVVGVAPDELSLDVSEGGQVSVDYEKDGKRHRERLGHYWPAHTRALRGPASCRE